ncbi:hypothetical protein F5Y00DRAFT_271600 [Daldinia vernicosa]|uniref:uncharacterized protein n=1 Tax=Daldinia vernicosa TaxID=114800 RepID=UPI002008B0FE|nr:uncharacterized protein F5Y00DRAFT_271600 [Daldinia vernicosa]KAI0853114.1 hypothetical protein F5Y00DRAFT_271600 [Daldinia vernicosa]
MDPLSILMACITLGGLIFNVSGVAAAFVCDIRAAETDVNEIISEFESISATIKLLTEDFLERTPERLRDKISGVVASCGKTIDEIYGILSSYYHPPLGTRKLRWVYSGKKSLERLKNSLNTHGLVLAIALDIANLVTIGDVNDNIIGIKDYTVYMKDDVAQILDRVERINRHLSDGGQSLMLRRWLADTSSYAESVFTSDGLDTAVLRQRYGITPESASSLHRAPVSINRESGYSGISQQNIRESISDEINHPDNAKKQWKKGIAMTTTVKTG